MLLCLLSKWKGDHEKETAVRNENENKIGTRKKQEQKIRHWWGVADHQSAICHPCSWKRFLGGA